MAECDEIPLLPCCWTGANDRYLLATIGYELCQILHTGIPVGPPSGTQDVNVVSSVTLTVQGDTGRTWNLDFASDQVDVTGSTVIVTGSVGRTWDLDFATDQVDASGSVVALDAATLLALETVTVLQGTSPWVVSGTFTPSGTQDVNIVSSITLTVQATDLDIRNLVFATDKVDASGSNVSVSNFPAVQDVNVLSSVVIDVSGSSVSVTNFPASFGVTQGTSPWVTSLASTTITGTVAVTQSTSPWVVSGTVTATPTGTQDVNMMQVGSAAFAQGQRAIGSSLSVVLATSHATIPVSLASTTVTGTVAVTQSTSPWITSLASTTITGTVAISAAALPLPSGAATSALQTQPGVDIGDVTVNNGAAGAAVNVQDGGNSLTVDGTVNVVIPPLPTIVATQVSVGTVQVAVPTSNLASRQTITFKALGANGDKIYIGLTGVTALTGFELDAGSSVDIDADSTVNFFAISASGTQKVSTIEIA